MRKKLKKSLAVIVSALLIITAAVQGQANQVIEVFAAGHASSGCGLAHNKVQYTSRTEEEARNNVINAANHYNGWTLNCLKKVYPSSVSSWCAWYVNRLAEAAGVLDVFYDNNNAGQMLQVMTNSYGAKGYYTTAGYDNAVARGNTTVLGSSTPWNGGNAYTPKKGDLVFFAWYNSSKQTTHTVSHVGVVVDYKNNGNGTATLHYADGNNGTAYTRNYKSRTINTSTGVIAESGWDGGIVVAFVSPDYANAASINACASGHSYNGGVVTKAATCAAEGVRTYTCTVCQSTKTESIPRTNIHSYNSGSITKAATCAADGVRTYTCTVCQSTMTESIPRTSAHSYNGGSVTKAATCVEEGVRTYTCTVCQSTMTESIPRTSAHSYNSGVITKEPTSTSEGVRTYTCTVCGATKTERISKQTQIQSVSLLTVENTRDYILVGTVATASGRAEIEYRWSVRDLYGTTRVVHDWTLNNEWCQWTPDSFGEYTMIAEARVAGDPSSCKSCEEVLYFNPYIKGKCQVPYAMVAPGQPGYLIGVETYENPNQSYQYEMLILDCTLLAEGKDAWVYTTGKFTVAEGAAGWCVWQPQYGYYWTLFRVYDAQGNMIDQACYPFVNAY